MRAGTSRIRSCRSAAGLTVATLALLASNLAVLADAPRRAAAPFEARFAAFRGSATKADLYKLAWALPKGGDLHNHHEYSVPMATWLKLASDPRLLHGNRYFARTHLGDCPQEQAPHLLFMTVSRRTYDALADCERKEYQPLDSLSAEQQAAWVASNQIPEGGRDGFFEDVVGRLSELEHDPYLIAELLVVQLRQAEAEGLLYLETQLDPRGFRHPDGTKLGGDRAAEVVRTRLRQVDVPKTVETRFQVSTVRFLPDAEEDLADGFEFVHRNRDLWVGVNLVGREDDPAGKPLRFLDTLRRLRTTYGDVGLSLHAGESASPDRAIHDTLLLGAKRIGHGINLLGDPETLLLMRHGDYLIESCLVSNHLLGYVPDLSKHPFPEYLRLGIPVSLNTDDRGAWDSNMVDEYFLAVTLFHLTWPEVVAIGRQSLAHSFAEPPLKRRLLERYDNAVRAFELKYGSADWSAALKAVPAIPSGYAKRYLGL